LFANLNSSRASDSFSFLILLQQKKDFIKVIGIHELLKAALGLVMILLSVDPMMDTFMAGIENLNIL